VQLAVRVSELRFSHLARQALPLCELAHAMRRFGFGEHMLEVR
jgi:hypothetical protein